MFLTIFYMIATWLQSWRLSSLRTRLQLILQDSELPKPSIMYYNKDKSFVKCDAVECVNTFSSSLCQNNKDAKLADLLWYQGNQRLYTVYPQQRVDLSNWLRFPHGKTLFPLFSHNNAQIPLLESTKMHLLIEAELDYYQYGSVRATKQLEDYGLIITWITDNNFGVILETDLDHTTKFFTTIMQGQLFINNGLHVSRIATVSVTGNPNFYNNEALNLLENNKIISSSQWDMYVEKLKQISNSAKFVSDEVSTNEKREDEDLRPENPKIAQELPKATTAVTSEISENIPTNPVTDTTDPKLSQDINNSVNSDTLLDSATKFRSDSTNAKVQKFTLQKSSQQTNNICQSRNALSEGNVCAFNEAKRPNILICADSAIVNDNVCNVLRTTLRENKYAIYPLSMQDAQKDIWMDQANLIIVCGNVEASVASQVVEYIVRGGKLLALCSDILKIFIPAFKTSEIRENELVRFSYGKWKYVRLLHHIFCYQASPVKTKFSQDLEEPKGPPSPMPVSTSISDLSGKTRTFGLKILGSEETWHTPCILLAKEQESGGKAVFSQIHLEVDPFQYEFEESKFTALKESNATRLEIISDILSNHLDIEVDSRPKISQAYSPGFFLGRHELKLEMLQRLKNSLQPNDVLKTQKLEIQFCNTASITKPASAIFLPIFVHRCPDNFSTVTYFENLNTKEIGRLVIYADVMTSSNDIVNGLALSHGLAVIPYKQTNGQGRNTNIWLSPEGCTMFTLQLHIPLKSMLGDRISLIQYLTCLAAVNAVKLIPGYEDINIKIKWPNDVYTGSTKIGGIIVTSFINGSDIICNIGMGINLSNSSPTTCINDIITDYNDKTKSNLRLLKYEEFLARVFSEIESLISTVQNGNINYLYNQYYQHWMHTDAEVTVMLADNSSQQVKILGIDEYGFLEVKGKTGNKFTVHPDGNSFDIFQGLIVPKY